MPPAPRPTLAGTAPAEFARPWKAAIAASCSDGRVMSIRSLRNISVVHAGMGLRIGNVGLGGRHRLHHRMGFAGTRRDHRSR